MKLFDICLESVLEDNMVLEGSIGRRQLEHADTVEDEKLRKTAYYKVVFKELQRYDENQLKEFNTQLDKFKKTLNSSEEEYKKKSTFKQIMQGWPTAIKDMMRGATAKKEGKEISEVEVQNGANIASFKLLNRIAKLAVSDIKAKK